MERVQCGVSVGVLLVLLAATTTQGQLFAGEKCSLDDGRAGLCNPIDKCDAAQSELREGKQPTICSFAGYTPVVCCPIPPVTPPKPTPQPKPVQPTVSKAQRMCEEYSKAVWRYDRPPTLQIGSKPIKVNQCFQSSKPLVIGGEKADPKEFPHMALVGYGEEGDISWWCGGSLISPRFVLTAAHCIKSGRKGDARWVRVGDLNIKETTDSANPQQVAVIQRIPHGEYKPPAQYNDIALLRLETDVEINEFVRPACLHTVSEIQAKSGIATGWGLTNWAESEGSDHLMKVTLPFQSTATCNTAYKSLSTTSRLRMGISEQSMVCAGQMEGHKDTCKGDSGGPIQLLMTKPYCMYDVIGVTSFGKSVCGAANSPAVYTRVSRFVPWIEKIVWP